MHKKLLLIIISLIFLTACVRIDNNDDYEDLVVNCLNKNSFTNNVALGYKYYIPKGVKLIKNYDYNQTFLIGEDYLYLYVDIISYYYESNLNYNDTSSYYYKKISYDGKNGYIKIDKDNDEYFVKIVYNYSKIESYTTYNNLNKIVTYSSIILNSIQYNDNVIENAMNDSLGLFSEVTYEVDKPEDASSNYSQYLEEYIQESDEETTTDLPDE